MWMNGIPIFVDNTQVAEVLRQGTEYLIRNLRPNGTAGVCFSSSDKTAICEFLNNLYGSQWSKGDRHA